MEEEKKKKYAEGGVNNVACTVVDDVDVFMVKTRKEKRGPIQWEVKGQHE